MDPDAFREAVSDLPGPDDGEEAPPSSYQPETYEPAPGAPGLIDDVEGQGEQQEAPPAVNWDDPSNPYRESAQTLAAERDRLAAERQQALYAQAQEAWRGAEIQFKQQTSGMDAFERAEAIEQFYRQREAGLMQAYGQLQAQTQQYQSYVGIQQRAQHLVSHYALPQEDAESLLAIGALDPSRMEIEARRRFDTNKKTRDLERRLSRLERGDERDSRVRSGADRFGGGGGRSLPRRGEYQGTREELAAALAQDGVLDALRGR